MSLLLGVCLALTLSLLLGTFLITHGHMRGGFLYLACLRDSDQRQAPSTCGQLLDTQTLADLYTPPGR
jgi:hypothetical protein